MANPEETFDPNDLESIDALLDEAELEAVAEDPVEETAEPVEEPAPEAVEAPTEAITEEVKDDTEDLLDSLDDLSLDDEPEVVAVSEPVAQEAVEPVAAPVQPATDATAKKMDAVPDADDFIERRSAAQATQNSNISAEDMDSIKKLIIIFGSVLSVLVITGIGIGVWSALAASGAGMDEETKTLIESIKVSSEKNGSEITSAEKTVKSVEKKLDAINYQLEQLATDMASMETPKKADNEAKIDPLGLGDKKADEASKTTSKPQTVAPVASVNAVAASPELMKKMTAVNSKLIKAQRRIDEVNNRVKKMQAQYKSIMHSVKTVEKQVLIEQAEKAEKAKKMAEQANKKESYYQYSAPDGGFYDQSVTDSYP